MLVLMWVLNSTAVAAMHLFLLNDFVNQSHISQLEHITDKTGYPLTLNFFYFINRYRVVALDSTCMFGTLF